MSDSSATPRTVARPRLQSLGFPRQEYWRGCHLLLQGIFLTQASNPCLLHLLHCQVDSLPLSHLGSPTASRKTLKRQLACLLGSFCPPPLIFLADNHTATLAGIQEAFLDEGPSDQGPWTNESQWAESLTVTGLPYTAGCPAHTRHAPLGSGQALCWTLHPSGNLLLRPWAATEGVLGPAPHWRGHGGHAVNLYLFSPVFQPCLVYEFPTAAVPIQILLITLEVRSPKLDKKEGVGNTSLPPEALKADLFPKLYLPKSLMPGPFPPAANPGMWDSASFLPEPHSRVRLPCLLWGHFCLHLGLYLGNPS